MATHNVDVKRVDSHLCSKLSLVNCCSWHTEFHSSERAHAKTLWLIVVCFSQAAVNVSAQQDLHELVRWGGWDFNAHIVTGNACIWSEAASPLLWPQKSRWQLFCLHQVFFPGPSGSSGVSLGPPEATFPKCGAGATREISSGFFFVIVSFWFRFIGNIQYICNAFYWLYNVFQKWPNASADALPRKFSLKGRVNMVHGMFVVHAVV